MGYPRHQSVPPNSPGTYHCVSRCVRRAWLCGVDAETQRNYEHRKQWMEDRILELATIFAVAVHAYAVMSNHFHLTVETDPSVPWTWSDAEVATRWLKLTQNNINSDKSLQLRIDTLRTQPKRMEESRHETDLPSLTL